MKNEAITLIKNKSELTLAFVVILSIFLLSIFYEYSKYQELTNDEVFASSATILNRYEKSNYYIYKLKIDTYNTFYTRLNKEHYYEKFQKVNILFISKYIDFYDYLKGFFTKTLFIEKIESKSFNLRFYLSNKIDLAHDNNKIKELFNALFLALPLSKDLREFCANFGISHLIAISGFHLGLFSIIIYFIINLFYTYIHQKYFNHRNKKFDILIVSSFILLLYLILIDIVPSFLRSFIMFILAILFLRSNIKVLSFSTLFITFLLIIALFPSYIFSLSLWFSIVGVFYIFLFLHYFKNLPKIYMILIFNFWIFLAVNPIVHYVFYQTSHLQLFSPIITLIFTIFYPLELFLHLFGISYILDDFLKMFLDINYVTYSVQTPLLFLVIYLSFSAFAVVKKEFFYGVNILLVFFNFYVYM